MTDFYKKLIEKSGFDEALIRHALEFEKVINIDEFSHLFFDAHILRVENTGVLSFDEAFYPYEFYDKLKTLGLPLETASLLIYISLFERAYSDFKTRIDNTYIFFDTVKRISDSAQEYFNDNKLFGLYDYRFLANHVRGNILRLGVFEYQYGNFEDKKAIILHVPDNADMEKAKRLNSYSLARRYFGDFPIIGDSWLLFGEHKKMLRDDSRIVDFMDDFDIISTHETCDYSELFHVFGRLGDYFYENLPKETSLQKAYAERVKKGLPVGSGVGKLKY